VPEPLQFGEGVRDPIEIGMRASDGCGAKPVLRPTMIEAPINRLKLIPAESPKAQSIAAGLAERMEHRVIGRADRPSQCGLHKNWTAALLQQNIGDLEQSVGKGDSC
jgi:hypothetical protein